MLLAIFVAVTGIGLVLAYLGKRGRRIDNHPVCAACGFDLSGRPENARRCSECGKILSLPSAIRIGNRKPRLIQLYFGIVLLITCGLATALLVYIAATDWNYLPYAPTWTCLYQADRGNERQQVAAFAELHARLGASVAKSIANRALAIQADIDRKWDPRWGDLVEEAHDKGTIDAVQWQQYLGQILIVREEMRPQVELGKGIFIRQTIQSRIGSPIASFYAPKFNLSTKLTARFGAISQSVPGRSFDVEESANYGYGFIRLPPSLTASMGPGLKRIELESSWEVRPVGSGTAPGTGATTHAFDVTVLPGGVQDARVINAPGMAEAIDKCLFVRSLSIRGNSWDLEVQAEEPPTGLAFDVFVTLPSGAEQKLTSMSFPAGQNYGWGTSGNAAEELTKADTVELIFRPSVEAASNTLNIFEIFGGEVRKKVTIRK